MERKRALITGASSGIGEAFAEELAVRGYSLTLVARRKNRLEDIANKLRSSYSVRVNVLTVDLSKALEVESLEKHISSLDDLSMLINNAGFGTFGKFMDVELKKHIDMVYVHNVAAIRLCKAALPNLIQREKAAVINVSSIAALLPAPNSSIYCSTKAFLTVFSEALQQELENTGVKVQALCPGFTLSSFHDTPEYKSFERGKIPKFMWMEASDVVRLSLEALGSKKTVFIPGFMNRLLVGLAKNPLVSPIMRFLVKKFRKEKNEASVKTEV